MQSPLKGSPKITNQHGTPGWGYFGKHAGVDYGVPVGTPVYAPAAGTIRYAVGTPDGGNILEIAIGGHWHRFLHLQRFVRTSGTVKEDEVIAYSGNTGNVTGAHLHWDVRKAGTTWNAAYSNYVNPLSLITTKPSAPAQGGTMLTLNRARILAYGILGRQNALSGKADADLKKNHVGKKTTEQAVDEFYTSKEGKTWREKTLPSIINEREHYKKSYQTAQKTIEELNKALSIKDNEIAKLKALGGDSSKWETLKALVRELVGKA